MKIAKALLIFLTVSLVTLAQEKEKESNTWVREIGMLKPLGAVSGNTTTWSIKPQGGKSLEIRGDYNMLRPLEGKRVEVIGKIMERLYSYAGESQLVRAFYAYELESEEKDLTIQGKIKLPESLIKEKDKVLAGFVITGDVSPIPFHKENFLEKQIKEMLSKFRGKGKDKETRQNTPENEILFRIPLFVRKGVSQAQYQLVAWIDKNGDLQMDGRDTQANTHDLIYTYRNGKWIRKNGSKEEELTATLKDIVIEFK